MTYPYHNPTNSNPTSKVHIWLLKLVVGIFLTLTLCPQAQASHFTSGEIFYQWIGNEPGKDSMAYRVYATLFSNVVTSLGKGNINACAFKRSDSSNTFNISLKYQDPRNPLQPRHTLSATNPYGWKNSGVHPNDPSGWNVTNSTLCASYGTNISEYRYVGEITLSSKASDWVFAIDLPCCRDGNSNLANSGNFYLEAELNNDTNPNSSPRISEFMNIAVCVKKATDIPLTLDFSARDGDGDSLIYQFHSREPLSGNCGSTPTPLGFNNNLSNTFPFPAHKTPNFNQKTGELQFLPSQAGSYVVKVEVRELRRNSNTGSLTYVGNTAIEIGLWVASRCRQNNGFIKSNKDSTIQKQCGDSTIQYNSLQIFNKSTLAPNGSDFSLVTSQNSIIPIKSATFVKSKQSILITLRDTLSTNDTMSLVVQNGTDSNTIFNVCGLPYRNFDTLATIISRCKKDSSVRLQQWNKPKITLYPNPVQTRLSIHTSYNITQAHYTIFNAYGQIVARGQYKSTKNEIPLKGINPGVYWLRLVHDDFTTMVKFLKD